MEIEKNFEIVVGYLESLSIMPKEMPGLEKLKGALAQVEWFAEIDPKKVLVVAGTNGKGSTCAILESLLFAAGKKVGFYSSPHLIDTTERIRVQKKQISKTDFIELFFANQDLIARYQLTHFEALTLMAGSYFFCKKWNTQLDYIIFEVGLGGLYDATNVFPHATSLITSLGLDHTNILGPDLVSVAKNKFGIVHENNLVVHHPLTNELYPLKDDVQKKTSSKWIAAKKITSFVQNGPQFWIDSPWGQAEINLPGSRAAENAATALTTFEALGFSPAEYLLALKNIEWPGRMQEVQWPGMKARLYLSGDHNEQGIQSLTELLRHYTYKNIHFVVGIGEDKDAFSMLSELIKVPNSILHLTETPFKGLSISEYPQSFLEKANSVEQDIFILLNQLQSEVSEQDIVLVTGSLYLVGQVLTKLVSKISAQK